MAVTNPQPSIDRPALLTPVVHVIMADGAYHQATVTNGDMVAWDLTRGPRKWPSMEDAKPLYQTFLAWRALTREHTIDPKTPWDVFVREAVQITATRPDGTEDVVEVDPSPPGPEPG